MAKKTPGSPIYTALAGAAAGAAAWAAYEYLVRPWYTHWGATEEEIRTPRAGDKLLLQPKIDATHAVTVRAPAAAVWPWLVQLGQGRGGFYSFEWIENTLRADIQNTDRILPEYQNLQVGDEIPLAKGGPGVPVAILEPGKVLVLHGDTRTGESLPNMKPGDYLAVSWGFYLDERPDGATRLVERFLCDWNDSLQNRFLYRLFVEPGAFIMERKMLQGIKERAERLARQGGG
jgi:hypothetical protein